MPTYNHGYTGGTGWSSWSDGSGGDVPYDTDTGKLSLALGQEAWGTVHDLGSSASRWFRVNKDQYDTGSGNATFFVRHSSTSFNQDDPVGTGPAWEQVTLDTKYTRTFQYIQLRIIGGQLT